MAKARGLQNRFQRENFDKTILAVQRCLQEAEALVSFRELCDVAVQRQAFPREGCDDVVFPFSGLQTPAHGGFLDARGESQEEPAANLAAAIR